MKGLENNPPDSAKISKTKDSKGSEESTDRDKTGFTEQPGVDESAVATSGADRGPQSTIHTNLSMLSMNVSV